MADSRVEKITAIGFLQDWAVRSIKVFEAAGLTVSDPAGMALAWRPLMADNRVLLETRVSELRAGDLWLFDGAWVLLTEVTPAPHPDDRVQLLYRQENIFGQYPADSSTEEEFTSARGNEVAVVKRTPSLPYRRDVLTETLVYHQQTGPEDCFCGWSELGRSHPEHVADVYEEKAR